MTAATIEIFLVILDMLKSSVRCGECRVVCTFSDVQSWTLEESQKSDFFSVDTVIYL